MKKLVPLLVAMVMLTSACGALAQEERTPVSIISFDYGRIVKEDDPIVEKIGEITGTEISVNIVPKDQFLQKLNLMIAAKDVPDIIRFNGYDHFQYIDTGALLDLTPYLEQYPSLKAVMPQEAWDLVTVDGHIYTIPNYNVPGKYSYYMRADWLENVGLKQPKTLEELREVLIAFTYNDPDQNGVDDTYGLSVSDLIGSMEVTCFMPIFGAYGIQPNRFFEKDGKAYNPVLTENYKQALQFCYQLYSVDKVVDPDIFVIQADAAKQNMVNSKTGSAVGWWATICEKLNDQLKMPSICPQAKWVMCNDITGPNGDCGMLANTLNSFTVSISADSPHIDKCLELLSFLGSDEGFMLSCYGEEGVHYTVDDQGNFLARTDEGTRAQNDKWLDLMSQYVYRVMEYQDILCTINPSYREYQEAAMNAKLYRDLFEGISTEESTIYLADLNQILLDWSVKFITGKEPIDKFDEFVAEYKENGGDLVLQSYIDRYNQLKGTSLVAGN
ncbi:MAG: extracellular solute-binding protein [Clostridiales bacterium]|nr:extracellular solute-binding protein [Clostridiales bacterium]MDO4349633.1 extracellular solute-binding protein [Eubacteriales bacterium]MDY4009265.1 extracellular solute-binding protein [Candidatus Limiplasma sp.]